MADWIKNSKFRANPVFWGLVFSFLLSLITLIIYLNDPGSADETLFLLLAILRYASFLVCVCSIYLLVISISRLINRPGAGAILSIVLFFFSMLYGAGMIVFNAFIVAIAGGN